MADEHTQSVTEQFGLRWASAADRYVRTWLDFLFRGPRRFLRRRGLEPRRYTSPTTFFLDSLLLSAVGTWAYATLKKGADAEAARDRIALEVSILFGQTAALLVIAMVVVWLAKYRRGRKSKRPWLRLRRLFVAFAYSSAVLLLLPFLHVWGDLRANWSTSGTPSQAEQIFTVVSFSLLHFAYLFAAIAATHHVPLRRLAIGGALVLMPLVGPVIFFLPWQSWVEPATPPPSRMDAAINAFSTGAWAPLAVSTDSRSPHSKTWKHGVRIDDKQSFVHFRVLCSVTGGDVKQVTVRFNESARRGETVIYTSALDGDYASAAPGYAEIWNQGDRTLVWLNTAMFACQDDTTWSLPDGQHGHEILLGGGLRLGNWKPNACAYIVLTFQVSAPREDMSHDWRGPTSR